MNKYCILAGMAFSLLFPALSRGQEVGLLRLNPNDRKSEGEVTLWGGVEEGRFRPVDAALFQWTAGAQARAVRHGKKVSWTGALSFEQTAGKHQESSLFLEPGYFPMDIVEGSARFVSRQTVRLEGGFLRDFAYEWAAGLKASFKGANQVKRANDRLSALGMEIQLEPLVTYVLDDDAGFVTSYLVQLRTERISMKPSADAAAQSYLFLDKGMRYGAYEDGLGAFPVLEFAHGFNGQYYSPEFAAGGGITWKRGRAGDNAFNRFRFPGSTLMVFVDRTFEGFEVDHVYGASYERQRDQLRELIPGSENAGYQSLSDRVGRNLGLKYEVRLHDSFLKSAGIDLDGNQWTERSVLSHPTMDRIRWYNGTATLHSSMVFGVFGMDLNLLAGNGWWKDRGLTGPEEQNGRLTDNWNKKMEYYLVSHVGVGGTLSFRVPAVKGLSFQLYGCWHRAFRVIYLRGKNREIARLQVDYRF